MEDVILGDFLRKRRKDLGLSLEAVASSCGVYRSTVNRWENGHTKDIKRSHIETLSRVLYIPIEVILGFNDVEIESADIVLVKKKIIKAVNSIKDKDKLENILKYVEVFGL